MSLTHGGHTLSFSGDVGRPHDLFMKAPPPLPAADTLVLESTYGNRLHEERAAEEALADAINRTAARGGVVVVPAFAVGRTQVLLFMLHRLKASGAIPDLPIFLNSPMAQDVTRLYANHAGEHRLSQAEVQAMCRVAKFVVTPEESMRLNDLRVPAVIVSASGMATGGRVVHHIKHFAPDPRNAILFAGYQAGGTRGAAMRDGATAVKIHGEYVPVRAEIVAIDALSSHADWREMVEWLRRCPRPPRMTYLTHGEPAAADAMRLHVEEALGWSCRVPDYLQRVSLP